MLPKKVLYHKKLTLKFQSGRHRDMGSDTLGSLRRTRSPLFPPRRGTLTFCRQIPKMNNLLRIVFNPLTAANMCILNMNKSIMQE